MGHMNNIKLYKNGFLVKSLEESCFQNPDGYHGIGRFFTWPLDVETDSISRQLSDEAIEKWFAFDDDRLSIIPDSSYIRKYLLHCKELCIPTECLWIESNNPILTTEESISNAEVIGFDYADLGMQISALADDLFVLDHYKQSEVFSFRKKLNNYGLFSSLDDLVDYVRMRDKTRSAKQKEEDQMIYSGLYVIKISKVEPESILAEK